MTKINLNHNHSYYHKYNILFVVGYYLKKKRKIVKTLFHLRRLTRKVTAKIRKNK